jgi:hypothetical protein
MGGLGTLMYNKEEMKGKGWIKEFACNYKTLTADGGLGKNKGEIDCIKRHGENGREGGQRKQHLFGLEATVSFK